MDTYISQKYKPDSRQRRVRLRREQMSFSSLLRFPFHKGSLLFPDVIFPDVTHAKVFKWLLIGTKQIS